MKSKPPRTIEQVQRELNELRELAEAAVDGYEKYLLDELNYSNLARIMTELRNHLPMGVTGGK